MPRTSVLLRNCRRHPPDVGGVGLHGSGQDWGIENAQPERVGEFLDAYERLSIDDDERIASMSLTVGSSDVLLARNPDKQTVWTRLRMHLARDELFYWSSPDEPDPENVFRVIPRVREVRGCRAGPLSRPQPPTCLPMLRE